MIYPTYYPQLKTVVGYGITLEQYHRLFTDQGGRCAICHVFASPEVPLAIDHDHRTQAIRGLLCYGCNSGIGKLGDNIDGLNRAIAYLKRDHPSFTRITADTETVGSIPNHDSLLPAKLISVMTGVPVHSLYKMGFIYFTPLPVWHRLCIGNNNEHA